MNKIILGPLEMAYTLIFKDLIEQYLDDLTINHYSSHTIRLKKELLAQYSAWCFQHGHFNPNHITTKDVFDFQRHLQVHTKKDGEPLSLATQRTRLTCVKMFFKWLYDNKHIVRSPAEKMILPSLGDMLPKFIFSKSDISQIMNTPDINTTIGLRDRAILETLYSTGIRRLELVNLSLSSLDMNAGLILIRFGKGNKDRIIPISRRACEWVKLYMKKSRRILLKRKRSKYIFISLYKNKLTTGRVSDLCRRHIKNAKIDKFGSCHIFRHTAATHMLENGADIRVIQAMLGHSSIQTTQLYTRVSVKHLKAVHERTHCDL